MNTFNSCAPMRPVLSVSNNSNASLISAFCSSLSSTLGGLLFLLACNIFIYIGRRRRKKEGGVIGGDKREVVAERMLRVSVCATTPFGALFWFHTFFSPLIRNKRTFIAL